MLNCAVMHWIDLKEKKMIESLKKTPQTVLCWGCMKFFSFVESDLVKSTKDYGSVRDYPVRGFQCITPNCNEFIIPIGYGKPGRMA